MRPFDLDQLRSFVTVVEAGSLTAAAPRLNRSQSAVSEQISKLETFAGVVLLQRGKNGVRPTPAGERLMIYARDMLVMSDRAFEDVRGATLQGELRLAVTDYFRPRAITEMLKRLQSRYPQLRLHVTVRKSLQIDRDAGNGEFDIGLSMRILDGRSYPEGIPIRRESLRWVAAAGFKPGDQISLPLLVLPDGCQLQRFIRQVLETHDVPYVVAHSASGVAGLQAALVAGLGVTCLNDSAVPDGVAEWKFDLPNLPEVEFSLLPPRLGEAPLIDEVRQMLAAHFT